MGDWVDVVLGDVRMGDHVRVKANTKLDARFSDNEGEVVGFRNGFVYVKRQDGETVGFQAKQLERSLR